MGFLDLFRGKTPEGDPLTNGGEGLAVRTFPVKVGQDDVTTYVLVYLKPGRTGFGLD